MGMQAVKAAMIICSKRYGDADLHPCHSPVEKEGVSSIPLRGKNRFRFYGKNHYPLFKNKGLTWT